VSFVTNNKFFIGFLILAGAAAGECFHAYDLETSGPVLINAGSKEHCNFTLLVRNKDLTNPGKTGHFTICFRNICMLYIRRFLYIL
jgi:hypothetical protein